MDGFFDDLCLLLDETVGALSSKPLLPVTPDFFESLPFEESPNVESTNSPNPTLAPINVESNVTTTNNSPPPPPAVTTNFTRYEDIGFGSMGPFPSRVPPIPIRDPYYLYPPPSYGYDYGYGYPVTNFSMPPPVMLGFSVDQTDATNWEGIASFLLGHVRPGPDVPRVYKCNICFVEFPNAQAFGGHMSSHSKVRINTAVAATNTAAEESNHHSPETYSKKKKKKKKKKKVAVEPKEASTSKGRKKNNKKKKTAENPENDES